MSEKKITLLDLSEADNNLSSINKQIKEHRQSADRSDLTAYQLEENRLENEHQRILKDKGHLYNRYILQEAK